MRQHSPDQIRNVGFFSHGGAGKTSLTEALLFDTGLTKRLGRVEDGTTVSDFDPDEIKRHHSVSTAIVPVEWRETKVNLLDPPGFADLIGEATAAMRVCDAAVIVLDASAGVEVGTEQVWQMAEDRGLPRLLFINKMDRENADFDRALNSARTAFGTSVAPIQFPIGSEKAFKGFVSLLDEVALTFHDNLDGGFEVGPIPDDLEDTCRNYRLQLIEAIAEQDEDLLTRYLDDQVISKEELVSGLRTCVEAGCVIPVLCGAATSNRGMQPLLDAIVDYVPAASRHREPLIGGAAEALVTDPAGPLAAIAFKTVADPHVGRVTYLRVLSGTLASNSHVTNASKDAHERVGHLFHVRGKEHVPVESAVAGDLVAVAKLGSVATGDTIRAEGTRETVAGITFPDSAYAAAVTPKTKGDLDKMGQALQRVVEEDPSLRLSRDPRTGEMILSGMGEPHVTIALDRMTRRYGVHVDLGLPRVAYRETVGGKATAEYKHKKQTGGAGQYGHVVLEIEPLPDDEFAFVERVVGGSVPRNFYPAVEKGVREAVEAGPLAGYPVTNVRVTLTDGSYHAVDSNEMAFKIAAREAVKKGVLAAAPMLLEPVLRIWVSVPEAMMGDVMGDLNAKRAHVNGMTPAEHGLTTIEANVPAAEVQRYATDLRSMTQGRGSFRTEFDHYQPVPPHIAEHIRAEAASHAHHHDAA